ncbi:hypothetical protein [Streptomyces sp. NBC_01408]|uniref:hypothetical protein n=1 Tax=Streptomyces sp. NBC_01408 TaxID=2903855 RepID=UPI00224FCE72|nr:hypothetical protein [Streptomyces sp. NBC_01408]MCX4694943.1 hypothetical protein [Streptomyces sp. NBC_01408]
MNRRSRRTTVTSLLACSLLAGGGAALAPTATAAPAIGTCTVKPADNGLSITISGSGWAPTDMPLNIDGGEGVSPLENVQPDGSFSVVRFQKSTDFTILPASGGFKNCTVAKADKQANKDEIRKARNDGFRDGVKAGRAAAQEDCGNEKPKPKKHPRLTQEQAVEAAYGEGFIAGATSAFDKFCRTGR